MSTTDQKPTGTSFVASLGFRQVVVSFILATAAVVGLNVAPAAAWTSPSVSGYAGGVTPRGVQGRTTYYKQPTALYGSQVPVVNVTGPIVSKSNGTSGAQRVEYRFNLYQYTASGWALAYASQTYIHSFAAGPTPSVAFNPIEVRTHTPASWRVTFSVVWRDAYGTFLGARNFDYAHASDYACIGVPTCSVGNGYVYI